MATYNISTLAQLQAMSSHLADDCVLLNDIDASDTKNDTVTYPNGFVPIGTAANRFTGSFDGQNFTIRYLFIDGETSSYRGLFSVLNGTAKDIKDFNLFDVDIKCLTGGAAIGVCVGSNVIDNVHVSGTVKVYGDEGSAIEGGPSGGGGGFAGTIEDATVTNCSSSVNVTQVTDVTSPQALGGFAGHIYSSTVSNCSASGSVTATFAAGANNVYVGGFVGNPSVATADFDNCYATGNLNVTVTATSPTYSVAVGGFAGLATGSTSDYDECFAYGDVSFLSATTTPAYVGGFVGWTTMPMDKCGAEGDVENYSTNATVNYSGGFAGYIQSNVTNCYARGKVCEDGIGHADAEIGGFVGHFKDDTLQNCYSTGSVGTGSETNGGGLVGVDDGTFPGTYTACFWDIETSGYETSAGGTGKTTAQMKTEATFTDAGWNLTTVWQIATYTRTPGSGTTVWFSGVGDYEDFEEGVNDADSFSLTLATTDSILWIEALESLIAGTGGDEWKIGSNKVDQPITPTNFTIRRQTNYGSKQLQPLKVNEVILFVDFVGRKLREMTRHDDTGKYVAPDLTALAEHITSSGITSMAIQKNPDSIVWATLGDGSLISMSYDREQGVVAWSNHPIDGDVQSVAVIPATSEDEVWLSVKRTMTGVNSGTFVIYIEKMTSRTFTDIDDCFFVDSGITYDSEATSIITGLDHLEGETVVVLGDGVVLDSATVSSGKITTALSGTTTDVSTAQVGLAYTSKLEPLKPVVSTRMGTSAATIVGAHEMGVSLLYTSTIQYGASDSDLYDMNLSDELWVDLSDITGLFTGTVFVSVDGGFSLERPLIISTAAPMPCTVRALIPRMEVTGR
jgi:hypothetical protein